jgi:RNA polymerase sigma-70 factor, ECF subfamily
MLPHLDAAHNFAKWLLRNEQDAQDVVQEAFLRAFKFFGGFHGSNGRAWLLRIVRNSSYTLLKRTAWPISPPLLTKKYTWPATNL